MVDEQVFVVDGARPHVGEELFVLFVLAELGGVGAEDASPEGGEEFAFHALLRVGFADNSALEIEELAVNGLKESEEGSGVSEFGVDALFEHGEEFVEGALEGLSGALRAGGTEEVGHDSAERGGKAGAAGFEDTDAAEDGVDVVESGGYGGEWEGGDGGQFALGPLHDDEDAVHIAVDVGKEFGQFNCQCLQTLAEIVELSNDDRCRTHVGCAHALSEVPYGNPSLLEVTYLLHAVFRIEYERLERLG